DTGCLGLDVDVVSRSTFLCVEERIEVRPCDPIDAPLSSGDPRPAGSQFARSDPRSYGRSGYFQFSRDFLNCEEAAARILSLSRVLDIFGDGSQLLSERPDFVAEYLANELADQDVEGHRRQGYRAPRIPTSGLPVRLGPAAGRYG